MGDNFRPNGLLRGPSPYAPAELRGSGGEGGIRTPDTVARMPHFECGAFNRSATSPLLQSEAVTALAGESPLATELPSFTAEGPPYPRVAGAVNARHRIRDDLAWRFGMKARRGALRS